MTPQEKQALNEFQKRAGTLLKECNASPQAIEEYFGDATVVNWIAGLVIAFGDVGQ